MASRVKQILITVFAFALLMSIAHAEFIVLEQAYTGDFSVSTSSSVSLCSCTSSVDYITVTNTNSFPLSILLSSTSSSVSLPSSGITIPAGASETIPYYLAAACDSSGETFTINVHSASTTKTIEKSFTTNDCQNLKIGFYDDNLTAGICEPFIDTFRLENVGAHVETYEIEVGEFEEYATLNTQKITLQPQSFVDIETSYQLPCTINGEQELSYKVTSEKSNKKAELEHTVAISKDYLYGAFLSDLPDTCVDDRSYAEIEIINDNDFSDFFRIQVKAPAFVDVSFPTIDDKETQVITLNPHTKTKLGMWITPSKQADIGVHDIEVTVTSKVAQTKKTTTKNITVHDCYNFKNLFNDDLHKVYACGGEEFTQDITLSHSGYGEPEVTLISSNEQVTFENDTVTFSGQETKNITVQFKAAEDTTSREKVTIEAKFRENTIDSTSFQLFTDTKENCYALSPVKDTIKVLHDSEYFNYRVQNVGDRDSSYETELTFGPAYLSLADESLDISRGVRSSLLFQIDRAQLLQDANTFNNGSIIGLRGFASVDLSHVNPEIENTYNFTIDFVDYPFYVKLWETSKSLRPCLIAFFVLSLLVIIFGVMGVMRTAQRTYFKSNNVLALILLLVFVVSAVVVYMLAGPPHNIYTKHDLSSNDSLHIRMAEDTPIDVDLDELFFDPDDNLVTFGVGSIEEGILSYEQKDSIISLVPRQDWYGNTSVSFFVVDEYNETASSPQLTVEVLPVEDYSFFELFTLLCVYFNLVVLFLLFVVVYVAFSFHDKTKEHQLTLTQAAPQEKEEPVPKKATKKKSSRKKAASKKAK